MHLLLLFYWEWLMGAGGENYRRLKSPMPALSATTTELDFNPDLTISFGA